MDNRPNLGRFLGARDLVIGAGLLLQGQNAAVRVRAWGIADALDGALILSVDFDFTVGHPVRRSTKYIVGLKVRGTAGMLVFLLLPQRSLKKRVHSLKLFWSAYVGVLGCTRKQFWRC